MAEHFRFIPIDDPQLIALRECLAKQVVMFGFAGRVVSAFIVDAKNCRVQLIGLDGVRYYG